MAGMDPQCVTCAQCGAARAPDPGSRFCGSCGAPAPAPSETAAALGRYSEVLAKFGAADGLLSGPAEEQLAALRQRLGISLSTHERLRAELERHLPAARVRLSIDAQTLRHFAVGTRCVIRLKLENAGALALDPVAIYAEVEGGARLPRAHGPAVLPGQSAVLPLWLIPTLPGFFSLRGVVQVIDLAGTPSYFGFSAVEFRVGEASDGTRVSIVNIDQSAARVVDNSRSQFAPAGADRGGLVGEGEFHPVALQPLSPKEAAARCPELAPAPAAVDATAGGAPGASPAASLLPLGARVNFTIRTEGSEYEALAVLAHGDLATIYDGRRRSDGARVAIKIAEDSQDNDLIQAEVSALRLLRSAPSPQLKHLPVVLDQLHTRDGRQGTVLEYLDGFDLLKVRERLPRGLPVRHLIWLMRRCLSVLGWAHSRGVLHGNLDPAHILCRAADHNVWVIDWCYAIVNPAQTGQGFRCLNEEYSPPEVAARKPPLPAADLYSLGKCMFYILGGDPRHKTLPPVSPSGVGAAAEPFDPIPDPLQRFLQFCVLDSPLSRAQDAWEAYRYLERLRQEIWGPHQFIELTI